MSLWVDKYRPTNLLKLDYHKDQAEQLQKIVSSGDFPHLLVNGPAGSGKKTRITCILRELYGASAEHLQINHRTVDAPSGKKIEIATLASSHHIEINASEAGVYDRVVVQEVIKSIAESSAPVETGTPKDFKVVVLKEVDRLTRDAQHSLRRTMEKYSGNCRLILCCKSSSKVISPLRSRCLPIRVAAPTDEQVVKILTGVCKKENVRLDDEFAWKVAERSQGNLRRALLMAEASHVRSGMKGLDASVEPKETDWELYLRETAKVIVESQTPKNLLRVRERVYELLTHLIPADIIFTRLLTELIRSCDASLKCEVTWAAAECEHRLQLGSKSVYHIEAFVAKFMGIYKRFVDATIMEFA